MPDDFISPSANLLNDRSKGDDFVIDSSRRLKLSSSRWNRVSHFFEKRSLDKKVKERVQELFQERYGFDDPKIFSKIWSKMGIVLQLDSPLTLGKLREIDEKFRKELIYHGPGIERPAASADVDKRVSGIVGALLHGGKVTKALLDNDIMKAVLVRHDPKLMNDLFKEIQHEFDHLLANPPKTDKEAVVWKAFHGNLIGLLPYVYPKQGDTIMIPHLNKDLSCTPIQYVIDVIDLPLSGHFSPMSALGLSPSSNHDAPTYLSFLGTTFPAASGFAATVLADFTPGYSVGEAVYHRNKETIENWMKGKKNIHAAGVSLGGSMVFHLLKSHSSDLSEAHVYVPAGLYPGAWNTPLSDKCKVNVYCQPGDIVSHLGSFPTGKNVELFHVYAHQDNVKENMIGSHVRVFTGCKKVSLINVDPASENKSFGRRLLTKLHQFLGPVLIFLPAAISLFFYHMGLKVHAAVAKIFKK